MVPEGVWALTGTARKAGTGMVPGGTKGRSVACLTPGDVMISGRSLAVRREHAMEADQMQAWTGDKRSQALHKLER